MSNRDPEPYLEHAARAFYEANTTAPHARPWDEVHPDEKNALRESLRDVVVAVLNEVEYRDRLGKPGDDLEAVVRATAGERKCIVCGREVIYAPGIESGWLDLQGKEFCGLGHTVHVTSDFFRLYSAGDDPGYTGTYESNPVHCDVATAGAWAVHLNIPPVKVQHVLDRLAAYKTTPIGRAMTVNNGKGWVLIESDSWIEWGEPSKGPDDYHFVVYFHAASWTAKELGREIAKQAITALSTDTSVQPLLTPAMYCISTAGDHSAQIKE